MRTGSGAGAPAGSGAEPQPGSGAGAPAGCGAEPREEKNWPFILKKSSFLEEFHPRATTAASRNIVLNSFHCCCSSALLCRFNRSYPHAKSCFLLPLRPSRHSRANVLMPNALSVLRCTICLLTGTMTIAGMPARAQRAFRKFFGFSRVRKAALCLTDFEVIQRI